MKKSIILLNIIVAALTVLLVSYSGGYTVEASSPLQDTFSKSADEADSTGNTGVNQGQGEDTKTPADAVTPGCIDAPVDVVSPSAVVAATAYAVTHGVASLEEALEWGNKLDVGVDITLTGDEKAHVLSQEIHSNVMLIIPDTYQIKIVTGQAVTASGILCNEGILQTEGMLVNMGLMENRGKWDNSTLSVNKGHIYNYGIINNEDCIMNEGMIENQGEITGGRITEDGVYSGILAKMPEFAIETCNIVYDGLSHGMVVSVGIEEGDRLEYSQDGENYSETMPSITRVDDPKNVYVRVLRGTIYEWKSEQLQANVRPAFPSYEVPELTAVHGQTLGDIADQLPEGMTFERAAKTKVGIVGTHTFRAMYIPTDTVNYVRVIGVQVKVNVVKSATQLKQDKIYLPRTIIKKGKLVYSVTKGIVGDCRVKVVKPKSKQYKTITIPASIKVNGITYKVVRIGKAAFENNSKLKKVVIGKNVKTIDDRAFANDRVLKKIVIKSKVLKTVGKKVTRHLSAKTSIYVPKDYYSKYKKLILKERKVKNIKFYKFS